MSNWPASFVHPPAGLSVPHSMKWPVMATSHTRTQDHSFGFFQPRSKCFSQFCAHGRPK